MTCFCDQPNDYRMAIRAIIADCGGMVEGYYDECIQVILPRDWKLLAARLEAQGLTIESMFYFAPGASVGYCDSHDLLHWKRPEDFGIPSMGYCMHANFKPTESMQSCAD
jgi:hypothetical protein